jgi:H+-transporting ATPase
MDKSNPEPSNMSVDERGLSSAEAADRLNTVGPNAITEKRASLLLRLRAYFWGPIPWMIEVAAFLSGAVGRWDDFGVIVSMLLINAGVGFFEEKMPMMPSPR